MMMTRRRPEGMQEAREGEGILQQEEACMAIEQEDTIDHPFILSLITMQHLVASFRMGDPRSSIWRAWSPRLLGAVG